jgi:hypothetical protein
MEWPLRLVLDTFPAIAALLHAGSYVTNRFFQFPDETMPPDSGA